MLHCNKCGKSMEELKTTAYGDVRCPDCFDDYLMTDRGKVEYFIGIAAGKLPVTDYDADFLGHVATCWKKYKSQLALTVAEIHWIECKAEAVGIFSLPTYQYC